MAKARAKRTAESPSPLEKATGRPIGEWLSILQNLAVTELAAVEPELGRLFKRASELRQAQTKKRKNTVQKRSVARKSPRKAE